MPVDKFGRMSDTKTKDTGVSLTYINNNYIRSDGGIPLSGSLDMRGNTIYNVADPVNPQDVVTKEYVDNVKGSGGGKHLIAVSTYYCGDLIKGEYQFPFGGNTCELSGFLMPQSGRIKKIKVRFIGKFKALPKEASEEAIEILKEEILCEVENLDKNGYVDIETWWNILLLNGNLFSIILFKNLDNIDIPTSSIISTYRCYEIKGVDGDFSRYEKRCNFDYDVTNYPLSEGDVINIRTEIERNVKSEWSYLFTFLIELDPL